MVSRRQALQVAGTAVAAAFAGCSSDVLGNEPAGPRHELHVDRIATEPVRWALYEPDEGELFGDPARDALDAILPEGRHRTVGYAPVGEGNYVEHEGRYFRTESFVSGRAAVDRPVVRAEPIAESSVPEDALLVDSVAQPSARVVKVLHSHSVTDGASGSAELLRGDAYVMVRPAERESRLVDDLDGKVVTMTDDGGWPYRIEVRHETVTLPEYTTFAVVVAESEAAFHEIVLASAVDVDLTTTPLSEDATELLDRAIGRNGHRENGDPSEGFEALLHGLGFNVGEAETGRILWYGESLFRASYYVNRGD